MATYVAEALNNPELYFQVKAYTGNGTAIGSGGLAVTLDGSENMQSDFVWLKRRTDNGYHNNLFDSVRGVTKVLYSNLTGDAEGTKTEGLTTFGSDGFTVGNDGDCNASSKSHVAWCWKGGGSASTNTSGSIDVELSASATSGFSVCTGTSASSGEFTFGHGLGTKVDFCIFKNRVDSGTDWVVFQSSVCDATTKYLTLGTGALATNGSSIWGAALPTTTLMGGTSGQLVTASKAFVAYNFSNRQGFLKCGKYVGNGNNNGTFVYTGFKPAWLLLKKSSAAGNTWQIFDNKRDTSNALDNTLEADTDSAEATGTDRLDFLSNGFKIRTSGSAQNASGATFIYIAFAEAPFVNSNGVPVNTR